MVDAKETRTLPWWALVLITAGYMAVLTVMGRIWDFDMTTFQNSTTGLLVVAGHLGVASLYLVILATWLGWWPQIWRDRLPMRAWAWILPGLMIAMSVCQARYSTFGKLGWSWAAAFLLTFGLIAFNEEVLVRGILLVGFRKLTSERLAFLFATGLFGLMHFSNMFGGQDLRTTLVQVVGAFLLGTALYSARRLSGWLIVPMIIHAMWDGSAALQTAGNSAGVEGLVLLEAAAGLLIITVWLAAPLQFIGIMLGWAEPKPKASDG